MGPCIAYCLCSRLGSVAVAVPAPMILCFAPLSIVTASAWFEFFELAQDRLHFRAAMLVSDPNGMHCRCTLLTMAASSSGQVPGAPASTAADKLLC